MNNKNFEDRAPLPDLVAATLAPYDNSMDIAIRMGGINIGTSPLEGTSESFARDNIIQLLLDANLNPNDVQVEKLTDFFDDGRYGYLLTSGDYKCVVEMPGLPLEQVNCDVCSAPRLWVSGGDLWWEWAVSSVQEHLTGAEETLNHGTLHDAVQCAMSEQIWALVSEDHELALRVREAIVSNEHGLLEKVVIELLQSDLTSAKLIGLLACEHGCGEVCEPLIVKLLDDREPAVKMWAVRIAAHLGLERPPAVESLRL